MWITLKHEEKNETTKKIVVEEEYQSRLCFHYYI